MKKLLFGLLLVSSCASKESSVPPATAPTAIDTLLMQTQINQTIATEASRKGDSAVTGKIEKTAQKIQHLETQVTELKKENNELKVKLNDATDNGKPYSGLPVSPY